MIKKLVEKYFIVFNKFKYEINNMRKENKEK